MRKDIEIRLVNFSSRLIKLANNLQQDRSARIIADQLIRSGTSSALNYGEAQNAQSKRDFISKISIVLKELRETHINLQIIEKSEIYIDKNQLNHLLNENDELLAIFTGTLKTAKRNLQ